MAVTSPEGLQSQFFRIIRTDLIRMMTPLLEAETQSEARGAVQS